MQKMPECIIDYITCHRTAFQDDGVNKLAWAEIVENNVCPADFLTAGLGSMHNSPAIYMHT